MSKETEKLIISPELKQRLIAAKENGSTAAAKILGELKKPRVEIMQSNLANNFYSKRFVSNHNEYKSLIIKIGMCRKDFSNENNPDYGNPDADERPSNQVWRSPAQFAKEFKNLSFTDDELTYFDSAIKETSKVTIRISNKFKDFVDAYTGANYSIFGDNEAPLHSSCMRGDDTAEIAADFYKNFAGCRIMVATNKQNEIVGRAIIWDGLTVKSGRGNILPDTYSFIDRKYYSFAFIRTMMLKYAEEHGIDLSKTYDDINHPTNVTPLRDIQENENGSYWSKNISNSVWIKKVVPQVKWHKHGAPYVDTMFNLFFDEDKKELYLCNNSDGMSDHETRLAYCHSTGGCSCGVDYHICPKCGEIHYNSGKNLSLCDSCYSSMFKRTAFGHAYSGKLIKRKGILIPAEVAKSPYCDVAVNVSRLFE